MKFMNALERKLGRFAIKNLMLYIIILYIAGFVIRTFMPQIYDYIYLDPALICQGQIWRIFTFLLDSPTTSIIFVFFVIYFYYFLGSNLEKVWGAFKFNFYYFSGVILTIVVSIVIYLITGISLPFDTYYINMSLFFAFAATFPEVEVLLFFVIPIKIKWLALIDAAYFAFTIGRAFMNHYLLGWFTLISIAVAMANFIVFFLLTRRMKRINPKEAYRKHQYKKSYNEGRARYSSNTAHRCHVCGRTSSTNPELTFRYCSKCNGNFEYCQDHLFTHQHIL